MDSEAPDKDCYTLPNGECIAPTCSLHGAREPGRVIVSEEDIVTIVSWWRGATEAPGGCSAMEAIIGMQDAVMAIEIAKRNQTGHIT